MANIKFFRKGNYVVIEDSVTGLYHEEHASNVYVKKKLAADTSYYITLGSQVQYNVQPIAEIQDEAGVVYSQAAFERLYQECTGQELTDVSTASSKASVTASNASQQLVAANPDRKGVWISNLSDKKAYISFGSGDATEADDSLIISEASAYIATTEEIRVIAESGVAGKIVARELL